MITAFLEVAFGLGCWLFYFSLGTDASLDASCTFHGKKYTAGESWHPYLEPQGVMYCLRCTCSQDTSVNCYQIQCPALSCPNPINDPHQCCPRCPELQALSGLQKRVNTSCQYNGTTYQHGDIFSSLGLFPSRQSNQCSQCSCSEGQLYCHLVTCPALRCASPQTVPDSCCQVCKGQSRRSLLLVSLSSGPLETFAPQCTGDGGSSKGPLGMAVPPTGPSLERLRRKLRPHGKSGTTVRIILKEKHKKACLYNGKTYSHGEVWHPTVRYIVRLPCILCTCRDGSQDCQRVLCPKEYPCANPEAVEGKCCKVCPEDRTAPTDGIDTTGCRVSVYTFVPSSLTAGHPAENLRKMAVERESSDNVDIYTWKLVKGIFHLIQIKKVKKQEFREDVQHFQLSQSSSAETCSSMDHHQEIGMK
ncbi:hypothetical protein JRQ81_020106 [Phrynocephalus forsythii]|uniref:VWFC domain-containing protein n=1 Tax=Phrynocephalus forsythii TaxID=171643 RepID=A0A9Q0XQN9_9SAUR|nr:hypothetical protein JRQ81_020106 [Phrynocephalus forsythii]